MEKGRHELSIGIYCFLLVRYQSQTNLYQLTDLNPRCHSGASNHKVPEELTAMESSEDDDDDYDDDTVVP